MNDGEVQRVEACRLTVRPGTWPYADRNRDAIAAHWVQARARNPAYFNGVIQILSRFQIDGGVFTGDFAATDFASFLYWREHGHADATVRDCFGCGIIRSAEGFLLLGRQAAGNLNAGRAYCPGGFIDPADVGADGTIDIDGSILREMAEETGLDGASLRREPGYILVAAAESIAIGIEFRSERTADDLRQDMLRHIASQRDAELAGIVTVQNASDLERIETSSYVPPLVRALLPQS
jgi:hypothetical protein